MLKREENTNINTQGKDLINGQLTYSLIAGVIFLINTSIALGGMFFPGNTLVLKYFMHLPLYLLIGISLAFILFAFLPVLNAIRVYHRKLPVKYPFRIKFFK